MDKNLPISENCALVFANVAGASARCRDMLIESVIFEDMIEILRKNSIKNDLIGSAISFLGLCMKRFPTSCPSKEKIDITLSIVYTFLHDSCDEVIIKCLCGILNITECEESLKGSLQLILDHHIPVAMTQIASRHISVLLVILRVLANMTCGAEEIIAQLIDLNILDYFFDVLRTVSNRNAKREVFRAISNICTGPLIHCDMVISHPLFYVILASMTHECSYVRTEAHLIGTIITSNTDLKICTKIVEKGLIKVLVTVLRDEKDPNILILNLDALRFIFETGQTDEKNIFTQRFEEIDGYDAVEPLQTHANKDVYDKALYILECFFHTSTVS